MAAAETRRLKFASKSKFYSKLKAPTRFFVFLYLLSGKYGPMRMLVCISSWLQVIHGWFCCGGCCLYCSTISILMCSTIAEVGNNANAKSPEDAQPLAMTAAAPAFLTWCTHVTRHDDKLQMRIKMLFLLNQTKYAIDIELNSRAPIFISFS